MSKERDIAYGRHSRIPECCIRFFVEEWEPYFESKWRGTAYDEMLNKSDYNYVACPECFFTKSKANIRICIIECGRECYEDFK